MIAEYAKQQMRCDPFGSSRRVQGRGHLGDINPIDVLLCDDIEYLTILPWSYATRHDRPRPWQKTCVHRINIDRKIQALASAGRVGDGPSGDFLSAQRVHVAGGKNLPAHSFNVCEFIAIHPSSYSNPNHIGAFDIR